ncbi:hypothetical protein ACFQ80_20395 [Isoptericola sp. NPDC056578]|uniref:hypothetical protein n=1 Tax=Isoptericola sp. NPDC056578 TaxID=3345870 RepID=UPI00367765B8
MQLTTLATRDPDNGLATTIHTSRGAALAALRDTYDIDPEELDAVRAAESRGVTVQLDVHEISAALDIDQVEVVTYHGEIDQVPVVQVDAPNGHRVRINLNDAPIYDGDPGTGAGVGLVSREQADTWAGRELTDDEWNALSIALPASSVPDAVGTIVDNLRT